MSNDELFHLSEAADVHAAALAGYVERCRAKASANLDYWYRTIKENLVSQKLNMVSATSVRVVEMKRPDYYEEIKLPGGKLVRDTPPSELYGLLEKLSLPGFSHSMPRNAALDLYERHIDEIGKVAAEKAVAEFLQKQESESC